MFEAVRHALEERNTKRKNRPFLEACMATCALIAIADGEVSLSERSRVDEILEAIDRFRLFDVHEAVDLFNSFVADIVENPAKGQESALDAIRDIRHEAGDAVLLVKVALAVSRADGVFLDSERQQCELVCKALGLTLADFE